MRSSHASRRTHQDSAERMARRQEQAALVESQYARALAAIPDGPAKTAGVALGQASARVNITRRQGDGADKAAQPYLPRTGPGEYQFTPPFDFAAQPGWGQV